MQRTFDSSALADYQDAIATGSIPTRAQAFKLIRGLHDFEWPLVGILNYLPPGNLYIRQQAALSTLYYLVGNDVAAKYLMGKADKALAAYSTSGFFDEGFSYLLYCKMVYDFCTNATGRQPSPIFKELFYNYNSLLAPDFTIPTNDTRRVDARPWVGEPILGERLFLHPRYSVFRFPPDTYLLITHNTGLLDHRLNGHCNYDWGHFVLYSRGEWRVAHPWYDGYPAKKACGGFESYTQNVILNGWKTKKHLWRLYPGQAPRMTRPRQNAVQLDFVGARRTFIVSPEAVEIVDEGGECSVFHFNAGGLSCLTAVDGANAGDVYVLDKPRYSVLETTGKSRSVRLTY